MQNISTLTVLRQVNAVLHWKKLQVMLLSSLLKKHTHNRDTRTSTSDIIDYIIASSTIYNNTQSIFL